ncbi:hypothetical protein [Gallaecimonas xiamenensis]|uniref:Motility protein n=1 Tax=Gallaecimonas xiamenensis 3-C-1 TaxID=745411 RepID=K2IIC5_9GAMM|nr:hypothetical protein [Gallaecimonas xiamenensis]EKE69881.1 hypothetical protein B3C1_14375 [Gallaecimonas xiamenensis 3-C-1]
MNVNSVQVSGEYEALAARFGNEQIRREGAMALDLIESAAQVQTMQAPPAPSGAMGAHIDLEV